MYLLMSEMITFVRLAYLKGSFMRNLDFIPMILCGMVKVVDHLAHVAHSTIHHGFVNCYLSQLVLI